MVKQIKTDQALIKTMSPESASILALQLLAFMASDEERVNQLQLETGLCLGDLRAGLEDPQIHAGVLDFILQNEPMLLEFASSIDHKPETIIRARMALPGFTHDA